MSDPSAPDPSGRPLTLGTAGHIDHGKTVLIEALTGVNTDRLPEERARGISIELGFAELELPSGRRLSVVDVPGHERFVRAMVAGATGIDMFLLVVAADDGVMPQTREHLAVIDLLEVPAGVVALTKVDAVDGEQAELVATEIEQLLAGGRYEGAEIVLVSAPREQGLGELRHALERVAQHLPPRARGAAALKLHIDRCFTLRGIGTVVTGTLWSGEIRRGEVVRVEPRGLTARARSVEVHDRQVERAGAGRRVAVNLAGIDRNDVQRGDVLTEPGASLRATYLVDVAVDLLPSAKPLARGARVHVHHGTRETPARVAPLEGDELRSGRRTFAQLRLERPIVPGEGDRIVLRQIAPPDTVGGGIVVDPHPRKHGPGRTHVERLSAAQRSDPLERLAIALGDSPAGMAEAEVDAALIQRLCDDGRAVLVGERRRRYFAPGRLADARQRILSAVEQAPERRRLARGAIATAAGLDDSAAQSVLEELTREGALTAHDGGFGAQRQPAAADPLDTAVRDALRDRLEPPSTAVLASELNASRRAVEQSLARLREERAVVRVGQALHYDSAALEHARLLVRGICEREGSVTIARLRDELRTSRKFAQALLEHFDTERLTLRRGDEHVLRQRDG